VRTKHAGLPTTPVRHRATIERPWWARRVKRCARGESLLAPLPTLRFWKSLLRTQARGLDDLLGAHPVVDQELTEFLGRVEHRLERALDHVAAAERRLPRDRHDLAAQLVDERPRDAGGRQQPVERAGVVARKADLAERHRVGDERRTLLAVAQDGRDRA